MSTEILNNIIGFSFFGFIVVFLILLEVFWDEKEKFDKTNNEPNVRYIWGLSILDGSLLLTFIVSLIIKLIIT